jgi:hypothetical protein
MFITILTTYLAIWTEFLISEASCTYSDKISPSRSWTPDVVQTDPGNIVILSGHKHSNFEILHQVSCPYSDVLI